MRFQDTQKEPAMSISDWVLIVANISLVLVTGWYARATHKSLKVVRKHVEIARLGVEIQACHALTAARSENQQPAIQRIAKRVRDLAEEADQMPPAQ